MARVTSPCPGIKRRFQQWLSAISAACRRSEIKLLSGTYNLVTSDTALTPLQRRSDDRDTDTVFVWLSIALRCGLVVLVTAALQQFQFSLTSCKSRMRQCAHGPRHSARG
jgi:hypothetical protein